jgi:Amt family ammonium transporter
VDESGAVFIHFSAGLAALAVAIAIGPRLGKYNRDGSTNAIPGHSLPLASAGILLILVTWICYVAGNAVGGPLAAFNSVLAAAAGVVASAVYSRFRFGRQDVFLAYAGLLGGLVSVTSAPDRLTPACAVAAGVVAGLIVPYAIVRLDLTAKIDDPASGIAIHGLAGLWSALAIAILAPGSWSQRASRLSAQAVALGIVAALTLAAFAVLLLALRFTTGIRCSETDEFDGLDLTQYDLNAYPDFQQTTIKSYHLREM